MRPRDAKTFDQFCELSRDNYPAANDKFSILISDDHVSIHPPNGGGFYRIPRSQFNAIVDWYMRDQPAKKAKASKRKSVSA